MWQAFKQYWRISFGRKITVLLLIALVIFLVVSSIGGYTGSYYFSWVGVDDYYPPSGLSADAERGKTLWDWMDLLIIPLVLVVGGFLLNQAQRQNELEIAQKQREQEQQIAQEQREVEREIAKDQVQETALQNYFDKMTELLLKENLRESDEGSEVRSIARARTLTVLRGLNDVRKGWVLRFLYESKLIDVKETIINLTGADLNEADLRRTYLSSAHLVGTNLSKAKLNGADLRNANLSAADLSEVDFSRANLVDAILSAVNLRRAILKDASLKGAHLTSACLNGADMRAIYLNQAILNTAECDGQTMWPEGFDPKYAGIIKGDE